MGRFRCHDAVCVGWAKWPGANASGGVPTIQRAHPDQNGGHGAKGAPLPTHDCAAASPSLTKMLVKKPDDTRVEVAVKGRSVEAVRIGAKARQARRELRRAGRQKSEVIGWHGAKVPAPH